MSVNSQVDIQCTRVKQELYRLKELIEAMPHEDDRAHAIKRFEMAYNGFDLLQQFVASRS